MMYDDSTGKSSGWFGRPQSFHDWSRRGGGKRFRKGLGPAADMFVGGAAFGLGPPVQKFSVGEELGNDHSEPLMDALGLHPGVDRVEVELLGHVVVFADEQCLVLLEAV